MTCNGCGRPVDSPRPHHCPEFHRVPAPSPAAVQAFARAAEISDRGRAGRTPKAQADIAAARAPSCAHAIHQPDCPGCAVDLATAQAEIETRATERAEAQRRAIEQGQPLPPDLDAALSNAALADTPAVREMGGPRIPGKVPLLPPREIGGPSCNHVKWVTGCRPCADWAVANGVAFAQHMAARPPGDMEWIAPPLAADAILLTGPEAEQYRALTRAARIAHETARAAQAAGATLRDAFQAFCAGIAPGKES